MPHGHVRAADCSEEGDQGAKPHHGEARQAGQKPGAPSQVLRILRLAGLFAANSACLVNLRDVAFNSKGSQDACGRGSDNDYVSV